jgi:hypothetical protein
MFVGRTLRTFWNFRIFWNIKEISGIFQDFFKTSQILEHSRILNNQEIPWSSEVKYLGLNLDKRLTFASHTAKAIDKAEKAFRILYSFLNRRSKLCIHNKLLLYKTCIRPILCYGVETWFDCATTHKKKLQIIQNKCLKIIKNRHWRYSTDALHEETNMPRIEDFGIKIHDKFMHRSRFSENPLILGLFWFLIKRNLLLIGVCAIIWKGWVAMAFAYYSRNMVFCKFSMNS